MADYIDRDAAIAACFDGFADCRDDCAANIRSIPAADVRPVVRGRWIWQDAPCFFGNPYGIYKCECGCLMPHKTNFCPNCGAKMEADGEQARRIKKQLALNELGYPYDLPKREES